MIRTLTRFAAGVGLAVALLVVPLSGASAPFGPAPACADGTCCSERNSVCNIGGDDQPDKYKKACDGSCFEACPGDGPGGPFETEG